MAASIIKTRAKRERRARAWVSDWESAWRARCKGIASANEILEDRFGDDDGTNNNADTTSEVFSLARFGSGRGRMDS